MRMKSILGTLVLTAVLFLALTPLKAPAQTHEMKARDKRVELSNGMRKLWEDHALWTRLFIVSAVGNLADLEPTTSRLLKNQTDIGDAIKPYYGSAAGAELTRLLRDHISIAADVVVAARDKNQAVVDASLSRWYANADTIAVFLHTANPEYWKLEEMKGMMKDHLGLTLEEATQRIKGEYSAEIATYDKVRDQLLEMADMLTDGIIMQHPDKLN